MADLRFDAQLGATLRRELEEELFGRDEVDITVSDQRLADSASGTTSTGTNEHSRFVIANWPSLRFARGPQSGDQRQSYWARGNTMMVIGQARVWDLARC